MKRIFRLAWEAFESARRNRATSRAIEHLDERTLRDIGLEGEANRVRERMRLVARLGAY